MFKKIIYLATLAAIPFTASCAETYEINYTLDPALRSLSKLPSETTFSAFVEPFTPTRSLCLIERPELRMNDKGHYKYVINVNKINPSQNYSLKLKRPAVFKDEVTTVATFPGAAVIEQSKMMRRKYPFLLMSSRGFLPGEKIDYFLESEDGKDKLQITFTPNPIVRKSEIDHATVSASLKSANPAIYFITLENFDPGEKIRYVSDFGSERLVMPIEYKEKMAVMHMPEVIGLNEGTNIVSFERTNGEILRLSLPWGALLQSTLKGDQLPPN